MLRIVKNHVKHALSLYPRTLLRREFESQKFFRFNERPVEFSFVFRKLGEIYPRTVLDVGTGRTALPSLMAGCGLLVTAIDNIRDYWSDGMENPHFHVLDDDITQPKLKSTFDMITCISVLEHVKQADVAIQNMYSLLNPRGHLLVTCPYSERAYVPNVYKLEGSSYGQDVPYVTQSFSRVELTRWLEATGGELVEQEFWRYWDGEFWTQGKQLIPPRRATASDPHQLTCLHLRKREPPTGAFTSR